MSMARRATRRWLVLAYWTFTLALIGIPLALSGGYDTVLGFLSFRLILFWWCLLGLLGGDGRSRPVRAFQGKTPEDRERLDTAYMTAEDIAWREQRERETRLDERDVNLRNAAHFKSYSFMRGYAVFVVLILVFLNSGHLSSASWLREPLLWFLLNVFLCLPQTMILWTEPDMEEAR